MKTRLIIAGLISICAVPTVCLTGIAMRKKGVTERGYHSPLTVGDGQDDPQDR